MTFDPRRLRAKYKERRCIATTHGGFGKAILPTHTERAPTASSFVRFLAIMTGWNVEGQDMADKKQSGFVGKLIKLVVVLLVIVVVLFAAGIIYGFSLESKRTFKSNVLVKADESDIHKYAGDLKQWPEWGPWKDEDPTMQWKFSDSTDEVGSWMEWTSDNPQNVGRLEITSTDPDKGIEYKIAFSGGEYYPGGVKYTEANDGIDVEWWVYMDVGNDLTMRYVMKIFDDEMQKMFDDGLAKLKTKAEAE
jgi:hypothetical protein